MEQVHVNFKECDAGWIFFTVSVGSQSVNCSGSEVWDPFPQMVVWLESIAAEAEACSFKIEEEGPEKEFKASRCANGSVRLIIEDAIEHRVLLEAQVDTRQCVSAFYKSLRSFAASPAYSPRQWEDETLSERLQRLSGQTKEVVMATCCEMKAEELKEKFFNAAPRVEVIFLDAKSPKEKMSRFVERVLHPDEIKHPEKEIEIAELYEFPEGFDYWLVDRRREFIAECLNDKVSSYSGCHLQALISDKLESWLGLS